LVQPTFWKKTYYQSNLHVQCNSYQNENDILTEIKYKS
jgi:hypothetical protein